MPLALLFPFLSISATQSWTISYGEISETISFTDSSGLFTEQCTNLKTYAEFILQKNPLWNMPQEFSFPCKCQAYNGAGEQFTLISAEQAALSKGRSLTIQLRSKDLPLEVSVI